MTSKQDTAAPFADRAGSSVLNGRPYAQGFRKQKKTDDLSSVPNRFCDLLFYDLSVVSSAVHPKSQRIDSHSHLTELFPDRLEIFHLIF